MTESVGIVPRVCFDSAFVVDSVVKPTIVVAASAAAPMRGAIIVSEGSPRCSS